MTTFDFSPLFRSSVGFDRLMNVLDQATRLDAAGSGYPPYNIEKTGEDSYRITLAVAGFDRDDLNIEVRDNTLVVSGQHGDDDIERHYLHRGIAGRGFQRTYQLADFVKVTEAHMENGLLHINLVRELPEEKKTRRIDIAVDSPARVEGRVKTLDKGDRRVA